MTRSAYDPPTVEELAEEERLLVEALTDQPDTISGELRDLIATARFPVEQFTSVNWDLESDPTGSLQRGQSPESVRGKIRVVDLDPEGSETVSFDFEIEGKNDPDYLAVIEKYRKAAGANDTEASGKAHRERMYAVMRDVAAIKKARKRQAAELVAEQRSTRSQQPATGLVTPVEVTTTHPVVRVSVRLGAGMGRLETAYRDVVIAGRTLTLVADPPSSGMFIWTPPEPEEHEDPSPIEFAIAGLDAPVRAFPLGLSYPYQGRVHYVLLIDRPTE